MPFGSQRPLCRVQGLKKSLTTFLLLGFLAGSVAACGYLPFGGKDGKNNAPSSQAANAPGTLDPRDLARPPSEEDGITLDPQPPLKTADNPYAAPFTQIGTFEPRPGGMLGALGFNLDTYLAEDIQDPLDRVKRLERAVSAIQRDLKKVAPPIQRLVGIETDIQELVNQLEILLENDTKDLQPFRPSPERRNIPPERGVPLPENTAAYSPPPEPSGLSPETRQAQAPPIVASGIPPPTAQGPPATAPPIAAAPALQVEPQTRQPSQPPPSSGGGAAVSGLRVGNYPDKIRLVLDVSGKTDYRLDLDNNEKILVIELPRTGWQTAREKSFGKSPVLKSYSAESINGGAGTLLVVQLKQATAIVYERKIDALSGPGERIVIDLRR